MTSIIWILAYIGLLAIIIGTGNLLFKWSAAAAQRQHDTEKHRSAVLDSLKRIETNIAKSNPAAR